MLADKVYNFDYAYLCNSVVSLLKCHQRCENYLGQQVDCLHSILFNNNKLINLFTQYF